MTFSFFNDMQIITTVLLLNIKHQQSIKIYLQNKDFKKQGIEGNGEYPK